MTQGFGVHASSEVLRSRLANVPEKNICQFTGGCLKKDNTRVAVLSLPHRVKEPKRAVLAGLTLDRERMWSFKATKLDEVDSNTHNGS